jgi:hypothetical protein
MAPAEPHLAPVDALRGFTPEDLDRLVLRGLASSPWFIGSSWPRLSACR